MKSRTLFAIPLLCLLLAAACTPDVGTVRVGPMAPPRPVDCPLELVDISPTAGIPAGLELLGYVRVIHEAGKEPIDPEVLKLVKPEACKLGGDRVSVGMSSNFSNGLPTDLLWRTPCGDRRPRQESP
jgi:hypothetical protein